MGTPEAHEAWPNDTNPTRDSSNFALAGVEPGPVINYRNQILVGKAVQYCSGSIIVERAA